MIFGGKRAKPIPVINSVMGPPPVSESIEGQYAPIRHEQPPSEIQQGRHQSKEKSLWGQWMHATGRLMEGMNQYGMYASKKVIL